MSLIPVRFEEKLGDSRAISSLKSLFPSLEGRADAAGSNSIVPRS